MIIDPPPTKHPSACLRSALLGADGPAGSSLSSEFPRIGRVQGPAGPSQPLRRVCQNRPGPIREQPARLMLIRPIHHVGNSLPPRVCFDLFLSGAATVKDEAPCGRAQTAGAGSGAPPPHPLGPAAELRAQATAAASRRGSVSRSEPSRTCNFR